VPESTAAQNQPQVSSDRVIDILTRDPMGAALWRAAVAEATVEAYQQRVAELEKTAEAARG
jgi:hypothetical protein